jgi:lysophospholipase L1-like esterase
MMKALLRAGTCLLTFLIAMEICARVEDRVVYNAPILERYNADRLRCREDGVPCNVPNVRYEKWSNNNLGFRGPDVALEKSAGLTRVVCLGASESYGLYESEGNEWPAQMRRMVAGRNIEVINASVVGLGLTDYEKYLTKHVLPLKPDLLIVSVNPFFYVVSQEKIRQNRNQPRTNGGVKKPAGFLFMEQVRVLPKLKQAVKEAATRYLSGFLQSYQLMKLQKEIQHMEQAKLNGARPRDIVPAIYTQDFSKELDRLIRFAKSHSMKIVLMTYPSLIGPNNLTQYPEIFLDNRRFFIEYSHLGMIDTLEKINAAVRSSALEHSLPLIDMSAILPKSVEYFGDNVHYTDRGARTVAEGVAKVIGMPANSASAAPREGGL